MMMPATGDTGPSGAASTGRSRRRIIPVRRPRNQHRCQSVCLARGRHGSEYTALPRLVADEAPIPATCDPVVSPRAVSSARSAHTSGVDPGPLGTEHRESADNDHRRHRQEKKRGCPRPFKTSSGPADSIAASRRCNRTA